MGAITAARLLSEPPGFIKSERLTGARAQGVRFERKALTRVEERAQQSGDWEFLRSPWIEFVDREGRKYCQPDGVLLPRASTQGIVVEVKLRHCYDAYFQLVRLYVPVLQVLFQGSSWRCCEIVRWFDPATSFPEPIVMTPDPLVTTDAKRIAVHIFNPAREKLYAQLNTEAHYERAGKEA